MVADIGHGTAFMGLHSQTIRGVSRENTSERTTRQQSTLELSCVS